MYNKLFEDIDKHICNDDKPSEFLQLLDEPVFNSKHPFTMLSCLKSIEQSSKYHPEGNVWNHTMMVLDEAALRKNEATDCRVFMWAALLHDIGKAKTTKRRKGKVTSYNHDKVGSEMVWEFLKDFEEQDFIKKVSSLVRWHMQILYIAKSLKFADLVTMKKEVGTQDIALLCLCDRLGRGNANRVEEERNIAEFRRQAGL